MKRKYGAQAPGTRRGKQDRPRDGTMAALVYDHFIANEGEPVDAQEVSKQLGITGNQFSGIVERLNNAYDVFILNQGKGYYILLKEEELI